MSTSVKNFILLLCLFSHFGYPKATFKCPSPVSNFSDELLTFIPGQSEVVALGAVEGVDVTKNYTVNSVKSVSNLINRQSDAIFLLNINRKQQDTLLTAFQQMHNLDKPIVIGDINNTSMYNFFIKLSAQFDCPFRWYQDTSGKKFVVLLSIDYKKPIVKKEPIILTLVYSPSHDILAEQFLLPSLKESFDMCVEHIPQDCPTARWTDDGWGITVQKKIAHIAKTIRENTGSIVLYCDVDIQFFTPVTDILLQCLEGRDLVGQFHNQTGKMCSGLFAVRCTNETADFFDVVLQFMYDKGINADQQSMNYILYHTDWYHRITFAYLPTTFVSGGLLSNHHWRRKKQLFLPPNIHMHHATFARGVPLKIEQLLFAKAKVEQKTYTY